VGGLLSKTYSQVEANGDSSIERRGEEQRKTFESTRRRREREKRKRGVKDSPASSALTPARV